MPIESIFSILVEVAHSLQNGISIYSSIVYPTVFLGYFGLGGICCFFKRSYRKHFVVLTFCLFLTASVLAMTVYPFTHMQRYSSVSDQETTGYELRVTDTDDEIRLDPAAVEPMNARLFMLSSKMVTEMNDTQRIRYSRTILDYANSYKNSGYDSLLPTAPTMGVSDHWDQEQLRDIGEFQTVRVYRINQSYTSGSYTDPTTSESCVLEVQPQNNSVIRGC